MNDMFHGYITRGNAEAVFICVQPFHIRLNGINTELDEHQTVSGSNECNIATNQLVILAKNACSEPDLGKALNKRA